MLRRNGVQIRIRVGNDIGLPQITAHIAAGVSGGNSPIRYGSTTIVPEQWYFLVAEFNGATIIGGYLNGVFFNTSSAYYLTTTSADVLRFGRSGGSTLYQGMIDEARIYNRILSADEVQGLYQSI